MKKYVALAIVGLLFTMPLFAEPAKPESIRLMMKKTGAVNIGEEMMKHMLPSLKQLSPNAPESFWKEIMTEMDMSDAIELLVPIYQKHLTEQDVQAINRFYDTDAGKRLIKANPKIMEESMAVGQKWGREVAEKVIKKLKEKNLLN